MKKLKNFTIGFFALAALGFILQFLGLAPKNEWTAPTIPTANIQQTTSSNSEIPQSETEAETTEEPEPEATKASYDVGEMNAKITDSFIEAIEFNKEGHDGYEWTDYISDIKLQDTGAVHAIVTDNFKLLNGEQKTEVLNNVSMTTNLVIFLETKEDRPYYITAYDSNGKKVARSKMTAPLEYKFYD